MKSTPPLDSRLKDCGNDTPPRVLVLITAILMAAVCSQDPGVLARDSAGFSGQIQDPGVYQDPPAPPDVRILNKNPKPGKSPNLAELQTGVVNAEQIIRLRPGKNMVGIA